MSVEARESAIEGHGLHVTRAFVADERIRRIAFVREIAPGDVVGPGERAAHVTRIGDSRFLVGHPDRCTNHSCDPSAYQIYEGEHVYVHARRALLAGDEVTFDYLINNAGGDSWRCTCGAARCRGMTGRDFFSLPADLQREYRPLLAPWFVAQFGDRLLDGA